MPQETAPAYAFGRSHPTLPRSKIDVSGRRREKGDADAERLTLGANMPELWLLTPFLGRGIGESKAASIYGKPTLPEDGSTSSYQGGRPVRLQEKARREPSCSSRRVTRGGRRTPLTYLPTGTPSSLTLAHSPGHSHSGFCEPADGRANRALGAVGFFLRAPQFVPFGTFWSHAR